MIRRSSFLPGVLCGLLAARAVAAAPNVNEQTIKAWGQLLQVEKALERYVATSELSSIHNEDVTLRSAISVLDAEKKLFYPERQQAISALLVRFGREIADLHDAADAFDNPSTKARMKKVQATHQELKRLYPETILAAAGPLAARMGCPMHREVVGKDGDRCPKCGMELDQPVRIPLLFTGGGTPALHTVQASVRLDGPLERGKEVKATLRLKQMTGNPVIITDLRVVHTQRIHLLIIDASLTDYHHVHPLPTAVPGEYAFTFTPTKPGTYRAWADLRTTLTGFQEYAMTDISAAGQGEPLPAKAVILRAELEGLRYTLTLDKRTIKAGEPMRARLRVTDAKGRPFKELEPVMATFAHLVAFHEDHKTVLHIHPKATKLPLPTHRGGPELEFQIYAPTLATTASSPRSRSRGRRSSSPSP